MKLLNDFQAELKNLAPKDAHFLLAVSGGLDSCVMIDLFHKSKLSFSIAHCNFQLRNEESDKDEQHVRETGKSISCSVYVKKFNTSEYAEKNDLSIQMAARALRYEWFNALCNEMDFGFIVTAHHADDQSETMLLNLIKGRSIHSLAGIPSVNKRVIRPLLSFNKAELKKYAEANSISWREDASNATDDYERNFIRNKVVPLLQQVNPSLNSSLKHSNALLKEASAFIMQSFDAWKKTACSIEKDTLILKDIKQLQQHPLCSNFLMLLLQPSNFSTAVIREISENLDAGSGKIFLSSTHKLSFDRNSFFIEPGFNELYTEFTIDDYGIISTPFFEITIEKAGQADFNLGSFTAFLDGDKLSFPLTIRTWKHGDSFIPFGMQNHKKLSDFFIDKKVPLTSKNRIWLLISGGEIAWVTGFRIDQRFAISDSTKTIFKITFAVP